MNELWLELKAQAVTIPEAVMGIHAESPWIVYIAAALVAIVLITLLCVVVSYLNCRKDLKLKVASYKFELNEREDEYDSLKRTRESDSIKAAQERQKLSDAYADKLKEVVAEWESSVADSEREAFVKIDEVEEGCKQKILTAEKACEQKIAAAEKGCEQKIADEQESKRKAIAVQLEVHAIEIAALKGEPVVVSPAPVAASEPAPVVEEEPAAEPVVAEEPEPVVEEPEPVVEEELDIAQEIDKAGTALQQAIKHYAMMEAEEGVQELQTARASIFKCFSAPGINNTRLAKVDAWIQNAIAGDCADLVRLLSDAARELSKV